MPAIDYAYDPTGELAANLIQNEVHQLDVSTDRSVFPAHQPFYGDQYGLVVEGRTGSSPWVELFPNIDYQFSPIFIEAAAKTGKQVFSYIIMVTEHEQVRLRYQAMGKYTDSELIAQVAASTHDRSKVFEWSKIYGDAVSYHPRVRDPDVIDKDPYEIINIGLQRILEALEKPNSSTIITAADITSMEQRIGAAASKDDVKNSYKVPTEDPVSVTANNEGSIIDVPAAEGVAGTFVLVFVASDGRIQMTNANFVRKGNDIAQTIIGETFSEDTNDELFTFVVSVVGDRVVLNATPIVDGSFSCKVVYVA